MAKPAKTFKDLGYGATADMEALLEEISKLLVAYASAIESNRSGWRHLVADRGKIPGVGHVHLAHCYSSPETAGP
jgi:hypothetical protein